MKKSKKLIGLPIKDAIIQISKGILEAEKILNKYPEMPKLDFAKLTFKTSRQTFGDGGLATFIAFRKSKSSLFEEEISYEITTKKQIEPTDDFTISEMLTYGTKNSLEPEIKKVNFENESLNKTDNQPYNDSIELYSIPIYLEIASDIVKKAAPIIQANRELNGGIKIESVEFIRLLTITKTDELGFKLAFFGGEQGTSLKKKNILFHKIDLSYKNR